MTPFALVTGDFVPTGGMDLANFALADYLSRAGHPVELVTHRASPSLVARPHVKLHGVRKPLNSYFLGSWFLNFTGKNVGYQLAKQDGRVVTNGGNCLFTDINWVHYVHKAYRPTVVTSRSRRVKAALEYKLNLRAERRAIQAARIVICNSERTRRDVIEKIGVSPSQAITVYYGTNPKQFYPAETRERMSLRKDLGWPGNRPVVLFIGALGDRRKGFDTLLEAWSRLHARTDWDPILVVIGRGAELPAWRRRISERGMENAIEILGFREDVQDLLRAADALVAPTRYEAYGLGVHEALCCGLPAIVTATAGVAERYPPELQDLLLPDAEDINHLVERLTHWRANLENWRQCVVPTSKLLRSRTWDDMSREFVAAVGDVS